MYNLLNKLFSNCYNFVDNFKILKLLLGHPIFKFPFQTSSIVLLIWKFPKVWNWAVLLE